MDLTAPLLPSEERSFILLACIAWVLTDCWVLQIQSQLLPLRSCRPSWGHTWVWREYISPVTLSLPWNSLAQERDEDQKKMSHLGLLSSKSLTLRRAKWNSRSATTTDLENVKEIKAMLCHPFSHSTPLDNSWDGGTCQRSNYMCRDLFWVLHSLPEELGARKGRIEAVADAIF